MARKSAAPRPTARRGTKNLTVMSERTAPACGALSDKAMLLGGFFGRLFSLLLPDTKTKLKIKQHFGAFCERFVPFRLYKNAVCAFLCASVRASSAGFFGFGLIGCVICAIRMNASGDPSPFITDLAFCAALILAAVPMAFSNSRWCEVLSRSLFMKLWLKYIGGYRTDEIMRSGESQCAGRVFSLIGVLLGFLSAFMSPAAVFFGVLAVVTALQILFKPELGLSLSILLFAFIPGSALTVLALFTLFSFLIKLLRGKRVVSFDVCDVFVFVLFAFMSVGALFSLVEPQTLILAFVFYILFAKFVRTADQARRYSGLFVFTLLAFSVTFFFIGFVRASDNVFASYVRAVFDPDKNTFVVPVDMVMMLLPVAAVGVLKKGAMKVVSFVSLALGLCTLIFNGSSGAMLCALVSLILLTVVMRKKMIWIIAGTLGLIGLLFALMPDSLTALFSGIPTLFTNVLSRLPDALRAIFERPAARIVFGEFSAVETGLSLWGDFLVRFGLAGLAVFAAAVYFVFRKAWFSLKESGDLKIKRLAFGVFLSAAVLFLRGFTALITLQSGGFVFSWLLMGILCGLADVSLRLDSSRSEL